tara:strand:- start:24837 stop:25346 length:510 start_codon:yes stop_codon:yes gene_type:complete
MEYEFDYSVTEAVPELQFKGLTQHPISSEQEQSAEFTIGLEVKSDLIWRGSLWFGDDNHLSHKRYVVELEEEGLSELVTSHRMSLGRLQSLAAGYRSLDQLRRILAQEAVAFLAHTCEIRLNWQEGQYVVSFRPFKTYDVPVAFIRSTAVYETESRSAPSKELLSALRH